MKKSALSSLLLALMVAPLPAYAQGIDLEFEQGEFSPTELTAPAHTKFLLRVDNDDSSEIELTIPELGFELPVPAGTEREAYLGPLEPGNYEFEDALDSSHSGVLKVK